MNILHQLKTRNGDPCTHEEGVGTYVEKSLVKYGQPEYEYDRRNDLGQLDVDVQVVREAFADLLSLLADKGIVNLEEVVKLSKGTIGEAAFIATTSETSHL